MEYRQVAPAPDYSGLQVDDRSIHDHQSGLQVYYQPESYLPEAIPSLEPKQHYNGPIQTSVAPPDGEMPPAPATRRRRRRVIVIWAIVGALVAITAVVVGCVLGLRSRQPADSSLTTGPGAQNGSTPSPTAVRSVCRGVVCPQILTAATLGSSTTMFARGTDNGIWYAPVMSQGSGSSGGSSWQSLGGGPFISQPIALTWQNGTVMSVMGVADPDRQVRQRTYNGSLDGWSSGQWENLMGQASSPVTLCLVNGSRIDAWATEPAGNVMHNFFMFEVADFWSPNGGQGWQGSANWGTQRIMATPGVACRQNNVFHDLVTYGQTDKLIRHATYSDLGGWSSPVSVGGNQQFHSHPVILTTSDTRFDFFGVGADLAIYHFSYTDTAGHSGLESLGGAFQSVPSAILTSSSGTNIRFDLVALSTRDTIQHSTFQGGVWSPWEDLGVFGNSAPLLVRLTTQPAKIAVLVLGTEGQVNQTTWTISSDASWKGLQWTATAANLTSAFYGI